MKSELDRIKDVLSYDRDTGDFTWVIDRGRYKKGTLAGYKTKCGYLRVQVFKVNILLHRLAWAYINGCWPENEIDHINLNKSDNRIENLRQSTRGENERNKTKYVTNKSGYKGVSWKKRANKWVAQIQIDYKKIHIGYFDDPKTACVEDRKSVV